MGESFTNIPTETDTQKGPLTLERQTGRGLTEDGRTSPSMDVGDTYGLPSTTGIGNSQMS